MAVQSTDVVKLTPADFEVLAVLHDGRNLAANIAAEIGKSRKYINRRMGYLLDYGLVEKVGPVDDSGLYELTEKGRVAYKHRAAYHDDDDVDFEALLEHELEQRE